MPDILTHVLVGYSLGMVLAVRYEWLTAEYVTLVMTGALSLDFVKIDLPDVQVYTARSMVVVGHGADSTHGGAVEPVQPVALEYATSRQLTKPVCLSISRRLMVGTILAESFSY